MSEVIVTIGEDGTPPVVIITPVETVLPAASVQVQTQEETPVVHISVDENSAQSAADSAAAAELALEQINGTLDGSRFVEKTAIYNDLDCELAGKVLDARQGKILRSQIDGIKALLASDNINLDTVQEIIDFVENLQTVLNTILVNDLITGGTTKALTAEQGKILKSQIDGINTLLASDNLNLDNVQELVDAIETLQSSLETILVNDLTTGGVTKALTAEMGKTLKGLIDSLSTVVSDKVDKITGYSLTKNNLTDLLKSNYDTAYNWVATNGANVLTSLGLKADKTYVDTQDTATLNTAKSYTDTGLATKADLVGGKVPQSQSQGSNLTYNSVNGVITLTDPAGVNHTIDLPIENLFQNAGYDSGTRSLTLTTNGGGTIVVPLSDLVDLPEIVVSANANPVAVPTTGQRLYLRSDNGSYWIAAAGAWAGPFLGVTAAEKTTWNGKETAFSKNTAFNKNFGTAAGTTMEGNDSRANNGQTAFGWGNHAGLYRSSSYVPSWSEVTGKPSTFTPSAHSHAIAEVTGLQSALDGKQPAGSYVFTNDGRLSDARPASDVYTWAKQSTKPSYVFSEIGIKPTTLGGYGITDGVTSTGSNASGTWNINIQGYSMYSYKLCLDDSVMANTIYGNYMGLRQSYGGAPNTLGGMPESNWYTSLKLLHNNSSGYFSEIASSFTGVSNLYHRNMIGGVLNNWVKVIDSNNIMSQSVKYAESLLINSANGIDLNLFTLGRHHNYNGVANWVNGPNGVSYGTAYNFGGSDDKVLALQVLADVNHNSTSSTKDLYFRTGNNLGWQNDWKTILHSGNFSSFALAITGGTLTGALTATAFYASSDIRLKNIIKPTYKNPTNIKLISYTWKDKTKGEIPQVGYPAQQVQKYMPHAVNTDSEGMLSVNYIQVLVAKVSELELKLKRNGIR
jgi:hypothetical protein